jgi:hypothetical protein
MSKPTILVVDEPGISEVATNFLAASGLTAGCQPPPTAVTDVLLLPNSGMIGGLPSERSGRGQLHSTLMYASPSASPQNVAASFCGRRVRPLPHLSQAVVIISPHGLGRRAGCANKRTRPEFSAWSRTSSVKPTIVGKDSSTASVGSTLSSTLTTSSHSTHQR